MRAGRQCRSADVYGLCALGRRGYTEALAAGYVATDRCVEHPTHGLMGLHYKNPERRDATPEVEQPEILLYQRMSDGTLKLNGVEYVVPLSAWTRDDHPILFGQRL
jgi:hypothetical protein